MSCFTVTVLVTACAENQMRLEIHFTDDKLFGRKKNLYPAQESFENFSLKYRHCQRLRPTMIIDIEKLLFRSECLDFNSPTVICSLQVRLSSSNFYIFSRFTPYVKSGAEDFILGKDKEQIAEADTITIVVSTE